MKFYSSSTIIITVLSFMLCITDIAYASNILYSVKGSNVFLTEDKANEIITSGRNKAYYGYIPTGKIQIKDPMDPMFSNFDEFKKMRLGKGLYSNEAYNKVFMIFQKAGLIQINTINLPPSQQMTLMGGKIINVQLTDYGKKEVIGPPDGEGRYKIKLGEMKVNKIIKAEPYYNKNAKSDNEYALIYGIFDYYLTSVGKAWYRAKGEELKEQYKFKVVLYVEKVFGKDFKYGEFDWGTLDEDGWKSSNIPPNQFRGN